ncbi:transcription repressor OFP6-like [Arachis duranensis]|uniref:Transcription repressor n=1 Tax=Arachis duranensis TaxID=130453 RepID=A0A6P4CIR2_ARADU|nr:transcription repressor OFP6-like [Arachis duranensis]
MAASSRRKLTLNNVSVKLGCGSCRRRKPKLLLHFLFNRKPNNHHHNHSSSSYDTSTTTTTTTTTFSPFYDDDNNNMMKTHHHHQKKQHSTVKGFGRVGSEGSVAVEKDSEDPFLDFKHSMLQMILENEIYTKQDLSELLNCFLQLNSPHHHAVILRAFTDICNGVFSNSLQTFHHHFNRKSRDF